jgi:hypothetical protein
MLGSSETTGDLDVRSLPPIAALSEMVATCESVQRGREAPQARDRQSLKDDIELALTSLGPNLDEELQPALTDFIANELAASPKLFDDRGGVLRLLSASRELVTRLRRPPCSQAAWRDLLAAVRDGDLDVSHQHLMVLRELEESLGHEWKERAERLRGFARAGNFTDCKELLSLPADQSAQVAWFIFANADLPDGYLRVGQVQFFSSRL